MAEYVPLLRLSAGEHAEAFLALAEGTAETHKLVVLKRARGSGGSREIAVRSLVHEARILLALTHENVVRAMEFADLSEGTVLVLDYVPGISVRSIMNASRPPWWVAAFIALDTARALVAVHSLVGDDGDPLSVVHCDLNPGNILVTESASVRLIDFSAAHSVLEPGLEARGVTCLSAPERLEGMTPSPQADAFGLGALLHFLLSGELTFARPDQDATVRAVRMEEPSVLPGDVPPALVDVVRGLLVKDRDQRTPVAQAALGIESVLLAQRVVRSRFQSMLHADFGRRMSDRAAKVRALVRGEITSSTEMSSQSGEQTALTNLEATLDRIPLPELEGTIVDR